MSSAEGTTTTRDRGLLLRHGLRPEYATLGWNIIGLGVLAAALSAGSPALAGFGLDSLIEVFASLVVVWQLKGIHKDRETRAMRLIGVAFAVLAAYLLIEKVIVLAAGLRPATSGVGIVWTALTFVVMLALAWGKIRTGDALGQSGAARRRKGHPGRCLPGRRGPGQAGSERAVRVVVGRPVRRCCHHLLCRPRGTPRLHTQPQRGHGMNWWDAAIPVIGGVVLIYAVLLVLLALYARKHPETVSVRDALRLLPDLLALHGLTH